MKVTVVVPIITAIVYLLLSKLLEQIVQHILYIIRQQLKCIHEVLVLAIYTHSCWEQLWSLPQVQPIRWQLAPGDPFYLQLLKCFNEDISDGLMRKLIDRQLCRREISLALQKFSCPDGTHYSESLHLHSIVATCLNGTCAVRALNYSTIVGCKPSACLT